MGQDEHLIAGCQLEGCFNIGEIFGAGKFGLIEIKAASDGDLVLDDKWGVNVYCTNIMGLSSQKADNEGELNFCWCSDRRVRMKQWLYVPCLFHGMFYFFEIFEDVRLN